MNRILREKKGFTLVELAIVLVIIGLILGIGAGMVGPLMKRAKTIETNDIVNAAVESVISYSTSSKRLPVWRDINDAVTAPNEFHYLLRNRNDAWGNPLFYTYDGALFNNDICGKKTTALSIVQCADSACTPATQVIINNVAFIVYSRGENINYQTILPGGSADVPVPVPPPSIAYVYPTDVTMNADRVSGNISIPNTQPLLTINDPVDNGCVAGETRCMYDDIVKWVTLDELRTKIGCQGAQLKIVNNELPYSTANNPYPNVAIIADGGIPFAAGGNYKWCIKGTMPTGMINPTPGCPATTSCTALVGEGAAQWMQANNLTISGTPTTAGSYRITVLVRDNNDGNVAQDIDNCTEKTFVLTINP